MVDEESVEVWFHVNPPERISLPERDSVFTNSAGRIPQVGGSSPRRHPLIDKTLPGLIL